MDEVWVVEHTEFNSDTELCGIFLKQEEAETIADRLAKASLDYYQKHNKFNEKLGIIRQPHKLGLTINIGTVFDSHSMAPKAMVTVRKVKIGEIIETTSIVENAGGNLK